MPASRSLTRRPPRPSDPHAVVTQPLDLGTEDDEQLEERAHVADVRHVLEHHVLLGQERRRDDGQCGVLVARGADRPVERRPPSTTNFGIQY
jgi:hypothetical protein